MTIPPVTSGSTSATLDDLVEVLNDGINFFGDAAELSREESHARMFTEFKMAKAAIADALRTAAPLGAEVRQGEGSLRAGLLQGYTDLRSRLSEDPDAIYLAALEQQEDRILEAFRIAVDQSPPSPVRDVAREKLPQVKKMHDRLHALKETYLGDDATDTR